MSKIQGIDKALLYEMPEAEIKFYSQAIIPRCFIFSKDFNASKYSFVVIFLSKYPCCLSVNLLICISLRNSSVDTPRPNHKRLYRKDWHKNYESLSLFVSGPLCTHR